MEEVANQVQRMKLNKQYREVKGILPYQDEFCHKTSGAQLWMFCKVVVHNFIVLEMKMRFFSLKNYAERVVILHNCPRDVK